MARTRIIKPGFFKNEELAECSAIARLLFAGLWTIADKEGRLEDRPKKIKAEILPYDECNADELLNELFQKKFITRYEVDGAKYIQIANFIKHQQPHHKEIQSFIPAQIKIEPSLKQAQTNDASTKVPLAPLDTCYLLPVTEDDEDTRARKIFTLGSQIAEITGWADSPNWTGNYSRIDAWLRQGFSFELDILPAIKTVMLNRKGQGPPSNLNYFDKPISDARATRLKPMPEGKPNANTANNHGNAPKLSKPDRARAAIFDGTGLEGFSAGPGTTS